MSSLKMCDICQNKTKEELITFYPDRPELNKCFGKTKFIRRYQPFKKNKFTLSLTCENFSHIKTIVLTLRSGGKIVKHASPENPQLELHKFGPLFDTVEDINYE